MKLEVRDRGGETLIDLFSDCLKGTHGSGAITVFVGIAKGEGMGGRKVSYVEVEIEEHARERLGQILKELENRFEVGIRLIALKGRFGIGEPITLALATAKDRKNAFMALREAVEAYKADPSIRLKEIYEDGSSKYVR